MSGFQVPESDRGLWRWCTDGGMFGVLVVWAGSDVLSGVWGSDDPTDLYCHTAILVSPRGDGLLQRSAQRWGQGGYHPYLSLEPRP